MSDPNYNRSSRTESDKVLETERHSRRSESECKDSEEQLLMNESNTHDQSLSFPSQLVKLVQLVLR